jgi:hypothetical protein
MGGWTKTVQPFKNPKAEDSNREQVNAHEREYRSSSFPLRPSVQNPISAFSMSACQGIRCFWPSGLLEGTSITAPGFCMEKFIKKCMAPNGVCGNILSTG